jgi:hypothetical protein
MTVQRSMQKHILDVRVSCVESILLLMPTIAIHGIMLTQLSMTTADGSALQSAYFVGMRTAALACCWLCVRVHSTACSSSSQKIGLNSFACTHHL